jgi:2,3-bisphosphoglycerate-dependent phosphoglycerate mutase
MASSTVATTLILIRHGERNNPASGDPPGGPSLNGDGKARAKLLVHVLGQTGIKAIYTSNFIRTQEMAKPLTALLAPITSVKLDDPVQIKKHILLNHAGKTILVIGHSNTVPALINLFTGGHLPDIDDPEFDNMFVLTSLNSGKAFVTRLKYGKRTP